ncbi:hypothetical protein [Labrys wisconsinensis]|uniref:Cytochrome P460 domain-containing protein n=1 Tax=Labrys wisconsinensis TaxID=425677 RepID=A0ABU0J122_9HYPH|nr:hypothetical protein [Labrys wisconsinensis]MDQ0467962.1 hypothetical protein [Labrys wisconsinensis]
MIRARRLVLALAALAGAPALAAGALQDEEPPLADLGRPLVHYATIARNDGAFRRLWIDEASLARARRGEPLPDGTTIAMETFYGPQNRATVFTKLKQGSAWLYGSFEPGQPDWTGLKAKTVCHACHIDAAEDLTFTLPVLAKFGETRSVARLLCDQPGRVPCDATFYDHAGAP